MIILKKDLPLLLGKEEKTVNNNYESLYLFLLFLFLFIFIFFLKIS